MLSAESLIALVREALLLSAAVLVPWLCAMWLLSVLLGAVQSALQLTDPMVLHGPRVLVGLALLVALGGWMARPIAGLAQRVFSLGG